MTVADLIALLNTLDPNATVHVGYDMGMGGGVLTNDCVSVNDDDGGVYIDADYAD